MSQWQSQQSAELFLRHVRGAIPGAKLQLAVLSHIVKLWRPAPSRVLDLGCGDGILGRTLSDAFPEAHVVFADFSDPMLDAARKMLGKKSPITVIKADFATPAWLDAVGKEPPFDIVVSGLAIHHLPNARKRQLYAEVHGVLASSGVFMNLDHVASPSEAAKKLFDEFFIDHLHDFHRSSGGKETRESVASLYYNRADKKENILAPVEDQCRWLRRIGFTDVDCFLKVFELALFGGRKA
jgi:ubiquinone/menaquinone biosynthesis C-methylase UbiE